MKVVDANLLIYAVNSEDPVGAPARKWLEESLDSNEPFGLTWIVLNAFLRITTNERVFRNPLSSGEAIGIVDGWISSPNATIVLPTQDHWQILKELLAQNGTFGNHVSDAHLAALAIANGARVYSTDTDFSRYIGLRWTNPLK